MKFASSLHSNATRVPLSFGFNFLNSSPISCPNIVPVRFILRRSYSISSETCACARDIYYVKRNGRGGRVNRHERYCSRIGCTGRTEQETSTSISTGMESSISQSPDGIDDEESLCNDASSTISGDTTTRSADYASSLRTVGLCVFSAVAFGAGLGFKDGVGKASEFFAGYLLEQSLSVDNLFVFVLIFKYFKVPLDYQNRVLSYGIAGAVVFRLSLILLGTVTLQKFEAVNLLLAGVLLYSSFKLFSEEDEDADLSDNFIVKTCQKFIPVTSNYDGNRFITIQDGVRKEFNILGRLHPCF